MLGQVMSGWARFDQISSG